MITRTFTHLRRGCGVTGAVALSLLAASTAPVSAQMSRLSGSLGHFSSFGHTALRPHSAFLSFRPHTAFSGSAFFRPRPHTSFFFSARLGDFFFRFRRASRYSLSYAPFTPYESYPIY